MTKSFIPETWKQVAMRLRWRLRFQKVQLAAHTRLDSKTQLGSEVSLNTGGAIFGSRIGRRSYFGEHVLVIHADVGAYCSVAPHVIIGGGTHPVHYVSTSPYTYGAAHVPHTAERDWHENPKTFVGHDVWIGYNAVVLPGVKVGNGAIVAAGAVVTKDVPPYAVVAGVPARVVRYRFTAEMVEWIGALGWWNWSDETLQPLLPLFAQPEKLRAELERGTVSPLVATSRG